MSHAMGVKCRDCKRVLQPDRCPEGCSEGHGFTIAVCLDCESVADACRCAGFYLACDKACPDFWLPDVPMSPDKGHDPLLTIETIEGRFNPDAPRPPADDPRPAWLKQQEPADQEDIDHAAETGQPSPVGKRCACPCAEVTP